MKHLIGLLHSPDSAVITTNPDEMQHLPGLLQAPRHILDYDHILRYKECNKTTQFLQNNAQQECFFKISTAEMYTRTMITKHKQNCRKVKPKDGVFSCHK